jgi:hypothetical protein
MSISFEGYPGCWLVSNVIPPSCRGAITIPEVFTVYQGACAECLPPVPVMPPAPLNIRLIKPGYNTNGCPPEYTEKTNCKFANAVYNQMIVKRYGVKMCCDLDVDKWDIKKQILDLKALYDPDFCQSAVVTCETCSVTETITDETIPSWEPLSDPPQPLEQ